MTKSHGFRVSIAVPLTVAAALSITGCNQLKKLTGAEEEEPTAEAEGDTGGEKKEEPAVDPDKPAVEVAREELPPAAIVEPEAPAHDLTGLDALLALVPAEKLAPEGKIESMLVVRDPQAFVTIAKDGDAFMKTPMTRLEAALASDPNFGATSTPMFESYKKSSAQAAEVLAKVENSGIQWDKGALLVETKGGTYVMVASDKPDAIKDLAVALDPDSDAEKTVCKAVEGHEPYAVCADSEAELAAYKPGGAEEYEALKTAMEAKLPGEEIEKANGIMFFDEGWITVATPPSLLVMSMVFDEDNADVEDIEKSFVPAAPKLLRAVQPGAGFMWMNMNKDALTDEMPKDPMAAKFGESLTGEVMFAGHYEPSALTLQFGLTDPTAIEPMFAAAEAQKDQVPKTIESIPGSEVVFETVEISVGDAKTKAVHLGVRKVPEADVLANLTGLTVDGWAFSANGAMTLAVGASAEAIGETTSSTEEGPSEELMAYFPAALRQDIDAGEVSMIMHMPVDALQSPDTFKLIDTALKNVEAVDTETIKAALALLSPLSSTTMWITHHGELVQIHFAVQGIGTEQTEEGKAALEAARNVAAGGDPTEAFGPLLTQFADSPRLPAYRARAGDTNDALVASGVGALAAVGALAVPVVLEQRNDALLAEMGVEAGAAEEAAEVSKLDPETPIGEKEAKAPKTTKHPHTTPKKKAEPAKEEKKEAAPKEEPKKEEAPKEETPKEEAKAEEPKEEAKKEEAPKEEAPKEEGKKAAPIKIGPVKAKNAKAGGK